jgi:hypothetical protein
MRTTITLEDGTARELKRVAHSSGKSFKQVVNETLRAGLAAAPDGRRARRYRLRPSSLGGMQPGFDLDKALGLAASLEDAEIARKLELRK